MQVVEAYRVHDAVEAHIISQLLDEAGIKYRLAGEQFASSYGSIGSWTMPSIFVGADDVERVRQLIAERLGHKLAAPADRPKLRYGLRAMMINFTAIAVILGLYEPLGSYWPSFAYGAMLLLVAGNFAAYVRTSIRRALTR